jgi:CRISPR/Cas system-associated protein Cas5 (RAMP superfamily)
MNASKIKELMKPFMNTGNFEYSVDTLVQLCEILHQYDMEILRHKTKIEVLQDVDNKASYTNDKLEKLLVEINRLTSENIGLVHKLDVAEQEIKLLKETNTDMKTILKTNN